MPGPPPTFEAPHFACPHHNCEVDANQEWWNVFVGPQKTHDPIVKRTTCQTCGQAGYWVEQELVWPPRLLGEQPSDDIEGEVLEIYTEARHAAAHSPRAAAALLRLAIERLVAALGETSGTLDARIGRLADQGELTKRTIAALDAVRITGNNAVHEGQIDPAGGDDLPVVLSLFRIVNMIVEGTRGMDREIAKLGGGERKPTNAKDD